MAKTVEQEAAAYRALKAKEKRYTAKQAIMLKKAIAASITVTEVEIDNYLKAKK